MPLVTSLIRHHLYISTPFVHFHDIVNEAAGDVVSQLGVHPGIYKAAAPYSILTLKDKLLYFIRFLLIRIMLHILLLSTLLRPAATLAVPGSGTAAATKLPFGRGHHGLRRAQLVCPHL